MKACFLIFVVVIAFTLAQQTKDDDENLVLKDEHQNKLIPQRFRREACNNMDEYRACDRFCRRLGLPGGACVNNKCDCDRF